MSIEQRTEAVLDTNVLVSAALRNGKPYRVLSLAEQEELVSVTSPAIVDELRAVLRRDRLPFSDEQVDELVTKILSLSKVIEPQFGLAVVEDDPDDDKILGLPSPVTSIASSRVIPTSSIWVSTRESEFSARMPFLPNDRTVLWLTEELVRRISL